MSDSSTSTVLDTAPSAEDNAAIRKQVRLFVRVGFFSILVTCLTVGFSFLTKGNVLVAMFFATCNAVMIALFTMHLKWEKATIFRAVLLALFFMGDLFLVTYLHYSDPIDPKFSDRLPLHPH